MKRELTCIICPRGCALTVDTDALTVTGNACGKGAEYGIAECTNPVRTVTSIMRLQNREHGMVSVKTAVPVKKEDIPSVMKSIRNTKATAPISIGDILIHGICGTDIVATKDVE